MEATTTEATFFFHSDQAFHREFCTSTSTSTSASTPTSAFNPTLNPTCFSDCWQHVQAEAAQICDRLNEDAFRKITGFLLRPHSGAERLLRVAVAIAGINLSDNQRTLHALTSRLHHTPNVSVATVGPWTAPNTAAAVRSFVEDFVTSQPREGSERSGGSGNEEKAVKKARLGLRESTKLRKELSLKAERASTAVGKGGNAAVSRKTIMSSMAPMQILEQWYKRNAQGCRLVLLIEDAESVAEDVLIEVIEVCAVYFRDKGVDISVILGMTGKSEGAHAVLSCEQTSRLKLANFKLTEAKHVVDELMERLILQAALPVRLEPSVISRLYDRFLSSDSSIFNFLQALKLALLDHFSTVPTAFLSMAKTPEDPNLVAQCAKANIQLNHAREAIRHNDELRTVIRPFLLSCVVETGKYMKLTQITRKRKLDVFIDVCDVMGSLRRRTKLKQAKRKAPAVDYGLIELIRQRLRLSGTETWASLLALWNEQYKAQTATSPRIETALEELKAILEAAENGTEDDDAHQEELTDESMKNWSKRKRRETLLKAAQPVQVQKNEEVAKKALKWWDALMHLWNMDSPYTSAFECVDTFHSLNNITNAAPRRSVLKSLVQPHKILGCKCCRTRSLDESKGSMPAICIALKHFNIQKSLKGRQHRIAVSEWYEEFEQTVISGKGKENSVGKDAEKLCKARFVQAITELQAMGFFKQSRKKDYVNSILYFVYHE